MTIIHFLLYLAQFLESEKTKAVEKIKTHTVRSICFFKKACHL